MAKAKPSPDAAKPRKWLVSLKYQPTCVVEGETKEIAIATYNAINGISQTDHQYAVEPQEQ